MTVQDVLHTWIDINTLSFTSDLDPIRQSRHGAVGPAAPAVLGDVLVPRHREVVDAVHIAPRERIREVVVFDLRVELVVRALRRGVASPHKTGGLDLVLLPDLRRGGVWSRGAFFGLRRVFFGYVGSAE